MVLKIKVFGCTKLKNAEHLGFHLEVQMFFNGCGAGNIASEVEMPLYDAAVLAEVDVVKRQRSSVLTAELEQLDKERDDLLSFLFATLDGAKHSPFDAAREAYRQLLPVMTPYRGIVSHPHVQESGEINGLLKDLRVERLSAYITALAFAPVMDLLESKNNAYMELDRERILAMPSKMDTDVLRGNVDELYHQIVDKINATVVLSPNAEAETLVVALNNYIDQMNASYNLRTAQIKKEEDPIVSEDGTSEQ